MTSQRRRLGWVSIIIFVQVFVTFQTQFGWQKRCPESATPHTPSSRSPTQSAEIRRLLKGSLPQLQPAGMQSQCRGVEAWWCTRAEHTQGELQVERFFSKLPWRWHLATPLCPVSHVFAPRYEHQWLPKNSSEDLDYRLLVHWLMKSVREGSGEYRANERCHLRRSVSHLLLALFSNPPGSVARSSQNHFGPS